MSNYRKLMRNAKRKGIKIKPVKIKPVEIEPQREKWEFKFSWTWVIAPIAIILFATLILYKKTEQLIIHGVHIEKVRMGGYEIYHGKRAIFDYIAVVLLISNNISIGIYWIGDKIFDKSDKWNNEISEIILKIMIFLGVISFIMIILGGYIFPQNPIVVDP